MSRTTYINVPAGLEDSYNKTLTPQDRFTWTRMTRKVSFFSRQKIKGLTQKSLLPQIAALWAGLSDIQKTAWSSAGAEMGLNGWRLFVSDTCPRLQLGMSGVATPSLFHQSKVGLLRIEAPATQIEIAQYHPKSYWISQKVVGKKGMYEPVAITESFALPLKIQLSYKSNLLSQGAGSYARFYAIVYSIYQGEVYETTLTIELDYFSDWKLAENTIASVVGDAQWYHLFIKIYNTRGDLLIDNVEAEHSAQNWARDPYCQDINQAFTRAFFQVPKHWVQVSLPAGAFFGTIYPED